MAGLFHRKFSKWLCPKHRSSVSASDPRLLTQKHPFNSVFFGHASGHRHCGLQKEIQLSPALWSDLALKRNRIWHWSSFLPGSKFLPWEPALRPQIRLNLYQGNCGKQKGVGWVSVSAASFSVGPNLWNAEDLCLPKKPLGAADHLDLKICPKIP